MTGGSAYFDLHPQKALTFSLPFSLPFSFFPSLFPSFLPFSLLFFPFPFPSFLPVSLPFFPSLFPSFFHFFLPFSLSPFPFLPSLFPFPFPCFPFPFPFFSTNLIKTEGQTETIVRNVTFYKKLPDKGSQPHVVLDLEGVERAPHHHLLLRGLILHILLLKEKNIFCHTF